MAIPVIDIFAGPGGLGEGFSSLIDNNGKRIFKIVLSVEKDFFAHQTLTLRSFFRQFEIDHVPDDYYEFIKGKIKLDELFKRWPYEAKMAHDEALLAKLGDNGDSIPNDILDKKIFDAIKAKQDWVLIGGPPCQAYSIVGRSRRKELDLDEGKDERVGLYKQYLRILAVHNPAVFIMENVKGLLSAKTKGSSIFSKILHDLSDPAEVYRLDFKSNNNQVKCPGYKIYSVTVKPVSFNSIGAPVFCQKDFILQTEDYGVPQTRHRLIMLGIRNDLDIIPEILNVEDRLPVSAVMTGLPKLRGGLSKIRDSEENRRNVINKINNKEIILSIDKEVRSEIIKQLELIKSLRFEKGDEFIPKNDINCDYKPEWYLDQRIEGVCNHISRGHMESDLIRYLFASCFAKVKNRSPKLEDFPYALLPDHKNVNEGIAENKFGDRFRVQLWDQPSKTITSHISKDGHYYIHPDPTQCRSLTVREAARIQTFPDNYYFCGPRTNQFIQVGNAVPPLLAKKIAIIVRNIFNYHAGAANYSSETQTLIIENG